MLEAVAVSVIAAPATHRHQRARRNSTYRGHARIRFGIEARADAHQLLARREPALQLLDLPIERCPLLLDAGLDLLGPALLVAHRKVYYIA